MRIELFQIQFTYLQQLFLCFVDGQARTGSIFLTGKQDIIKAHLIYIPIYIARLSTHFLHKTIK
jgi:hypothetical protein